MTERNGVPASGRPIVVVGGGIAGLAAALALRALGVECRVAEAAREIVPLGVGLSVLPHGARVLHRLGLADAITPVAVEILRTEYRDDAGRLLHAEACGRAAGLPFPQWSLHRGNLYAVLVRVLRERHGESVLRAGARLLALTPQADRVRARFEDRRHGGDFEWEADAIVGADGILSSVRAALHPGEGSPRATGTVLVRGLTWGRPVGDGHTALVLGAPGRVVSVSPVRRPGRDGRQLIGWVAALDARAGGDAVVGDWNRAVDRARIAPRFEGLRCEGLDVAAMIGAAEVCLSYPEVDRDPLDAWVDGRIALIGDAAHPVLPVGDNGASQALLDAEAIAECIAARPGQVPRALAEFQARRLAPANALVLANRERGPERLLGLARDRLVAAPAAEGGSLLPREAVDAVMGGYRRTAGFEREALEAMAARPSWSPPRRADAQ